VGNETSGITIGNGDLGIITFINMNERDCEVVTAELKAAGFLKYGNIYSGYITD